MHPVKRTLPLLFVTFLAAGCTSDAERLDQAQARVGLARLSLTSTERQLREMAEHMVDSLVAAGKLEAWAATAEPTLQLELLRSAEFSTTYGVKALPPALDSLERLRRAQEDSVLLAERDMGRILQ
jgi:hypothetical protein